MNDSRRARELLVGSEENPSVDTVEKDEVIKCVVCLWERVFVLKRKKSLCFTKENKTVVGKKKEI
jgi:hypothetical protein